MGQNTLGDHMHIQSIRSRHRACNIFPPLLDALLINARTVPALSESNGLHPAQEFLGIITQSTKLKRVITNGYVTAFSDAECMQDTETPTTKPQGRGKSSNSILSSDICLLYVVLRMQTCCSGVCRTYTEASWYCFSCRIPLQQRSCCCLGSV